MRGRRLLPGLLSLLCLLATSGVSADGLEDRPLNHYIHERWSAREGLPQDTILGSAQTPDGYLWFGTHAGLARFDGVSFRTFMRPKEPLIRRGSIWSVFSRSRGDLVFGDSGVVGRTDRT